MGALEECGPDIASGESPWSSGIEQSCAVDLNEDSKTNRCSSWGIPVEGKQVGIITTLENTSTLGQFFPGVPGFLF